MALQPQNAKDDRHVRSITVDAEFQNDESGVHYLENRIQET